MPLGAFRINTLARVLDTGFGARTSDSMTIQLFGDTQISTAQSKFGGSSIAMDGTGDYMKIDDVGNNLDFGTDDFTIEWWQYLTSLDRFAIDFRAGSSATTKILLYSYPTDGSADDLYFYTTANRISALNCLSANTWQHIALVRESSNTRLYVDGTQVGGTYTDTNNYAHTQMRIWHNSIGAENYTPPGYVDEFRISKGHARYSGSSFTVPTSAFTSDEHTHLLIHGDGTNGSTTITDDPPAPATGLTAIDPGTIRIGSSTITTKPASDSPQLTLSFWWRQNSDGTNGDVFNIQSGTSTSSFPGGTKLLFCEIYRGRVRVGSYGYWDIQVTDTGANPESTFGNGWWDNNWHHFVYSISGSNVDTLYVDGVDRTSNIYATTPGSGDTVNWSQFNRMSLLSNWTGGSDFSGGDLTQVFIDNSYYDLSNATTRAKFYDGGAVDMGTDGTDTGLTQPLIFHTGDTTTFFDLGGDTSRFNYGNTTTGTADGDISASDGPEF
jgi:hypothetical protein